MFQNSYFKHNKYFANYVNLFYDSNDEISFKKSLIAIKEAHENFRMIFLRHTA